MKKVIKTLLITSVLIIDGVLGYKLYLELNKPSMSELESKLIELDKTVKNNIEDIIGKDWTYNKFNDIVKECGEVQFRLEKAKLEDKVINLKLKDSREDEIGAEWDNKLLSYIDINGYKINDFDMRSTVNEKLGIDLDISIKEDVLNENITVLLDSLVIKMVGAKGKLTGGVMEVTNEGQEGRT